MDNSKNNKPESDQSILDEIMQQQDRVLRDPYGLGLLDRLGPNHLSGSQNEGGHNDEAE